MADKFSATAGQYAVSEQRGGDDLDAIVDAVRLVEPVTGLVVDVATGPGSTALALADALAERPGAASRVVGTDLSEGMVATAVARAAEAGIANVSFRVAEAAHLPIDDGAADAVTCRIAAHHFPDVPAALREIVRVLRPGGELVLLDSEAVEDPIVAAFTHELEVRRDPTHVRSFTAREWVAMIEAAGLTVTETDSLPKPKAFEPWLARGGIGDAEQEAVRELVRQAPAAARLALSIEYDEAGDPVRFADDKVLIVAAKPTRGGGDG